MASHATTQPGFASRFRADRKVLVELPIAVAATAALILDVRLRNAENPSIYAYPLALATCAPLMFARLRPMLALTLTTIGLITCIAFFGPYRAAIAVAVFPLYEVAVSGDRRRSLIIGSIGACVIAIAVALGGSDGRKESDALGLLLALGAVVVGDLVRSRRDLGLARAERELVEIEDRTRHRVDVERLRIARDVHDAVAHALVAINVQAGVASHLDDPQGAREALAHVKRVSADALRDLRATLGVVRGEDPRPLHPASDDDAIEAVLENARAAGLNVDASIEIDEDLPVATRLVAFRVVQEAVTNVMRHADGATTITVRVKVRRDALEVEIIDDGLPASPATPRDHTGQGIRGIRERVGLLGGLVDAAPAQGCGWRVFARIPGRNEAQ